MLGTAFVEVINPTLVRGGYVIHRQTAGNAIQRARPAEYEAGQGRLLAPFCFEILYLLLIARN